MQVIGYIKEIPGKGLDASGQRAALEQACGEQGWSVECLVEIEATRVLFLAIEAVAAGAAELVVAAQLDDATAAAFGSTATTNKAPTAFLIDHSLVDSAGPEA